jgi:catechol 2,3-dioxygenase-like lactoylglutathione lyase family enzyme
MELDGVLLYVRDLERSISFYETVLHLKLEARPAIDFAILRAGSIAIYLHSDPERFAGNLEGFGERATRGDGTILHFNTDDVDRWASHCSSCNHPISMGPINQGFGRRQCYIYDPDGYNIVVEQRRS